MNKKVPKTKNDASSSVQHNHSHPCPKWVPYDVLAEQELCPMCFKVVGERSRYTLVCILGKNKGGMSVNELTEKMNLRQPTVTHHLQVLHSVQAVLRESRGRERIYRLNRDAHCFETCKIPYK